MKKNLYLLPFSETKFYIFGIKNKNCKTNCNKKIMNKLEFKTFKEFDVISFFGSFL